MDALRQMSIAHIAGHAARHRTDALPFDSSQSLDFDKPFLCPTLTPLRYTSVWNELSESDRLRHTQLSALSFNELIAWFENGFSATLHALCRCDWLPADLRALFPQFIEDEARHQRMWWTLNRMAAPQWYPRDEPAITRVAPLARMLMSWLAKRPREFPVAIWLMLFLEERANEIARRCAMRRPHDIEPHFAAAYLFHVRDETRHVQIDWHLLEACWPKLNPARHRVNTWFFGIVVRRLLLRTEHAAMSVAQALARERPNVARLLPRIRVELRALSADPEFRESMFSRTVAPISFQLIDRFPELQKAIA